MECLSQVKDRTKTVQVIEGERDCSVPCFYNSNKGLRKYYTVFILNVLQQ